MYSYTYKYTQVQLFLIGRVSLFEEMDEWEFSNKILKLKEKMKKEQDEEEDIADTDFGKYFTQNKLIIIQEDVVSQYFCTRYNSSMIYHFTLEEEQGEEIQLLNENRDAGIGNVK